MSVTVPSYEDFLALAARVDDAELRLDALESTDPPDDPEPNPDPPTGFWLSGGSLNTNFMSSLVQWGNFRNRPCDLATVYSTRTVDWPGFVDSHFKSGQIATHTDKSLTVIVQTSPFPVGRGFTYQALIDGAYKGWWEQIGTGLRNRELAGFKKVILSIAWEMNGTYMQWGGGPGVGHYSTPDQYILGYQAIVKSLRKTYPDIETAWVINGHATPSAVGTINAWDLFPGAEYVTYVGIDDYDHYPPATSEPAFYQRANANGGLLWLANKAHDVGLQMVVPEWGVTHSRDGSGRLQGGGDNHLYIRLQYKEYKRLYEARILKGEFYFADPMGGGNVDSDLINANSAARAAYLELWGRK